jgi:hypothetical protein
VRESGLLWRGPRPHADGQASALGGIHLKERRHKAFIAEIAFAASLWEVSITSLVLGFARSLFLP